MMSATLEKTRREGACKIVLVPACGWVVGTVDARSDGDGQKMNFFGSL